LTADPNAPSLNPKHFFFEAAGRGANTFDGATDALYFTMNHAADQFVPFQQENGLMSLSLSTGNDVGVASYVFDPLPGVNGESSDPKFVARNGAGETIVAAGSPTGGANAFVRVRDTGAIDIIADGQMPEAAASAVVMNFTESITGG